MKLKKLLIILIFFLSSCVEYTTKKNIPEKKYYNSSGFALVYDLNYYKQKIINEHKEKHYA